MLGILRHPLDLTESSERASNARGLLEEKGLHSTRALTRKLEGPLGNEMLHFAFVLIIQKLEDALPGY